ncbi:MAG TPA: hypothetical protein VNE82_03705 [Candidatus Binataceae bacterium]|nr:hypothetical protein [Candidatus Binataceae bacterium]
MTEQEERNFKIESELNDACRDLRDTMTAVNAKVEQTEDGFRADRLIEKYPVGASCVAGAIGFLIGANTNNRIVGPALIAALFGYAISRGVSKDWSREDDGETRSDD